MNNNLLQDASYVTFDLLIPRGASFGLYGRRNALPTHTHHNFMNVISGLRHGVQTRATRASEVRQSYLKIFESYLMCSLNSSILASVEILLFHKMSQMAWGALKLGYSLSFYFTFLANFQIFCQLFLVHFKLNSNLLSIQSV